MGEILFENGMTLSVVSLPYCRYIMPYGLATLILDGGYKVPGHDDIVMIFRNSL